MKRIFLSAALLLGLCALATAQGKMQFGVTAQVGNYLQGQQKHEENTYSASQYQLNAGILAGLGVYAERMLGRHVAVHTGLNFSQSLFSEQLITSYPDQANRLASTTASTAQTAHFTVRQLALPIQLQLRAGGSRQFAFSVGAAPSFSITNVRSSPEYQQVFNRYAYICGDFSFYDSGNYGLEEPSLNFQVLYTVGLHYLPDAQNAIGLELWMAPKIGDADPYQYEYGYQNLYGKPFQMRSLQVSLRHGW